MYLEQKNILEKIKSWGHFIVSFGEAWYQREFILDVCRIFYASQLVTEAGNL